MDDTPPPLAAPIPGAVPSASPFGAPPAVGGGFGQRQIAAPGRPAEDPAKREQADRNYAAAKEFEDALPADARENRLAVYRLRPSTGFKVGHRPIGHILYSVVKDMKLSSPDNKGALENYCLTHFGKGLYSCEPVNAHGTRLEKLAAFTVATHEEYTRVTNPEDPLDGEDQPRRGFGNRGRNRSRDDDDDGDDGGEGSVDVKDLVDGFRQAATETKAAESNSSQSMLQIMLLMSKEQRQADEQRRRDERQEEQRREDKEREARRADDERRRADEERRRDERRTEEKKEDERRREDREREAKAAESRLTMLSGLFTAAVPLLQKLFEPKKDETLGLVLSKVLDNSSQQSATKELMAGMREVQTINAQVQVEGMKSTMAMQQTMNQEFMKQAIAIAREKPEGDAGGSWKDPNAIAALMGSAAQFIGQIMPPRSAGPAAIAAPAGAAAPQPGAPAATGAPDLPTGMEAVVRSLIALQSGMDANGRPLTSDQQQLAYNILLDEMPDDLAQAISTGDQAGISRISQPVIASNPRYIAWVSQPDVQQWLGKFLTDLRPQVAEMLKEEAAEDQAQSQPAAATPPPAAPAGPPGANPSSTPPVDDGAPV